MFSRKLPRYHQHETVRSICFLGPIASFVLFAHLRSQNISMNPKRVSFSSNALDNQLEYLKLHLQLFQKDSKRKDFPSKNQNQKIIIKKKERNFILKENLE